MISRQITEDGYRSDLLIKQFEDILHDVKTPISIIYFLAQDLEKAKDMHGDLKRYAASIKKYAGNIIDLLNEINNPDRMLGHSFKVRLVNYDIVNLTENIVQSTIDLAVRKNISITFDTNTEEKIMAIDRDLFERIMLNIISNAIKFTPKYGYVDILMTDNTDSVTIDVIDNGTGFAEQDVSDLFKRYLTNRASNNKNGAGIGLSIVKEMVDALGGQINASSCKDHAGAIFSVTLPAALVMESHDDSWEIMDFYQTKIT